MSSNLHSYIPKYISMCIIQFIKPINCMMHIDILMQTDIACWYINLVINCRSCIIYKMYGNGLFLICIRSRRCACLVTWFCYHLTFWLKWNWNSVFVLNNVYAMGRTCQLFWISDSLIKCNIIFTDIRILCRKQCYSGENPVYVYILSHKLLVISVSTCW